LAFVEIKVESPSPRSQYNKYIEALDIRRKDYQAVTLAYLTREGKLPDGLPIDQVPSFVFPVRWQQIWKELGSTELSTDFLVRQFCEFLKGKGATLDDFEAGLKNEVGIELARIESWLKEAFNQNRLRLDKRAGRVDHKRYTWHGYYLSLDADGERQFSVGFDFARPDELVFTTLNLRIDTDQDLDEGEMFMWLGKWYRTNEGVRWRHRLPLGPGSEFQKLSKDGQGKEIINGFIKRCLEQVDHFRDRGDRA
jgi:hypothetical protein